MKLPGPLTGTHPLTAWLNQLREYVIANTPRPTVGMELVRSSTGFSYKPKVTSGGTSEATGGRFLGPGWNADVEPIGEFPDYGTIYPFDFVYYLSLVGGTGGRAAWLFAWSDDAPGGGTGPVAQLRVNPSAPDLYLVPTDNSWMLINYIKIDASAADLPGDAINDLLDSYPDQ